jgi:hypothetical protein
LYYIPIFVAEDHTYIRIGVNVTAGVAGLIRLGIYNWAAGLPDTLLLDAGTVNPAGLGIAEVVIAQLLARGYYFLAGVGNVAPTLTTTLYNSMSVEGTANTPGSTAYVVSYLNGRVADVAGGLADPAPAPTSMLHAEDGLFISLRDI